MGSAWQEGLDAGGAVVHLLVEADGWGRPQVVREVVEVTTPGASAWIVLRPDGELVSAHATASTARDAAEDDRAAELDDYEPGEPEDWAGGPWSEHMARESAAYALEHGR